MPQGGEKPAPASSLTNFKSIGYRDSGACSGSTGPSFRRLTEPTPAQGYWRASPSFISETSDALHFRL